MNETYYEQEQEINLKKLFYHIMKHWRRMVVIGIVGAILVGGTKIGMELSAINDEEVLTRRNLKYEADLAEYEAKGVAIDNAIHDLERNLEEQTKYNNESPLMTMDPLAVYRGSVVMYIDTNYQIMPGSTYQNENPAPRIAQAFASYISSGVLHQYVLEKWGRDMGLKYMYEVLSVSVDTGSYTISISTYTGTSEENARILSYAQEAINQKKEELGDSLGKYTMSVTNTASSEGIDLSLQETQRNNRQNSENLTREISVKQGEKIQWELDEKKLKKPVVSVKGVIKEGIKWTILAGVILVVLIAVWYACGYSFSNKILDCEFLFGMPILGEVPKKKEKVSFARIDGWLARRFGVYLSTDKREDYLAATAITIGRLAARKQEAMEEKNNTIALVGDARESFMKEFAKALSAKGSDIETVIAGNTTESAEAARKALDSGCVVLVVEQGKSKKEVIRKIRAQATDMGKEVLGVVGFECDGV